jgi:hypothetical protein
MNKWLCFAVVLVFFALWLYVCFKNAVNKRRLRDKHIQEGVANHWVFRYVLTEITKLVEPMRKDGQKVVIDFEIEKSESYKGTYWLSITLSDEIRYYSGTDIVIRSLPTWTHTITLTWSYGVCCLNFVCNTSFCAVENGYVLDRLPKVFQQLEQRLALVRFL